MRLARFRMQSEQFDSILLLDNIKHTELVIALDLYIYIFLFKMVKLYRMFFLFCTGLKNVTIYRKLQH